MCLAYAFGMLSVGVCTTRQWQTSGQLVRQLNVCAVLDNCKIYFVCRYIYKCYSSEKAYDQSRRFSEINS